MWKNFRVFLWGIESILNLLLLLITAFYGLLRLKDAEVAKRVKEKSCNNVKRYDVIKIYAHVVWQRLQEQARLERDRELWQTTLAK